MIRGTDVRDDIAMGIGAFEPKSLQNGRYPVLKKIGEGGRGVVLRALDSVLDRVVAIKILKTEGLDDETYARFLNEARLAARLSHPNIAAVYDFGKEDGRPFLVMEYVEGPSLRGLLRSDGGRALDLSTTLSIARETGSALEYAHAQGILHRDIKPENIMLTKERRAKLMDFGLARALDKPHLTDAGTMIGTPAYMAPENALGKEADARTDLYSLGCVLYEMATGQTPFPAGSSLKVIYSHIHDVPVPPGRIASHLPAPLESAILRLLAKNPQDRYRSASEFLRAIADLGESPLGGSSASAAPVAPTLASRERRGFPTPELRRSVPLVGRETELAALREFVDHAVRGMGTCVMLTGEAGIGKSRLADETKVYAALRGMHVLAGNCLETETNAPYYPWIQITQSYVARATAAELHRSCGLYADEVARLVPEVAEKIPIAPSASTEPSERDRVRLFTGLTQFFLNVAREAPLFLELGDLTWADSGSLELLQHVARATKDQFVFVLGTYRDVELDEDSTLARVLHDLNRERLVQSIRLARLDKDGVVRLLESTFHRETTPAFVDLLYQRTGGNPFFVEEVLRSLVEEGSVFQTPSGRWERKPVPEIEIPTSVRKVIQRRLDRLDPESQSVLRVAAVLGNEFGFETLRRVCGLEDGKLIDLLERILKARLLRERALPAGRTNFVFTDPQTRDALYEEMSAVRRRRYHQLAAEALEALQPTRTDENAAELAHHYTLAHLPGPALRFSLRAAERASRLYAHEEAVGQYRLALELLEEQPDDALRATVLDRLGDEANYLGRPDQSLASWEEAIAVYDRRGDRLRAGDLHRRIGMLHMLYFLSEEKTRQSLSRARTILEGEAESAELAALDRWLAYLYWLEGDWPTARELAQTTLEVATRTGAHAALAGAHEVLGFTSPPDRKAEVDAHLRAMLDITREHNLGEQYIQAHRSLGSTWQMTGNLADARRWLEEGAELAHRQGHLPWEHLLRGSYLAYALVYAGELDQAGELAEATFEFESRYLPRHEPLTLCALGHVALIRGDWEKAEQFLTAALVATRQPILLTARLGCLLGLGQLSIERGDPAKGAEFLSRIIDAAKGRWVPAMWALIHARAYTLLVETALRNPGTVVLSATGEELARDLASLAERVDEAGVRAYHLRVQALLALQRSETDSAAAALEESVRVWRSLEWPYELGKTLYELGALRQQRGDRDRATAPLQEALEIFTRLKAHADTERVLARRELLHA